MGMISETFETAITWDRFAEFHAGVMAATTDAVRRVCGAGHRDVPLHARLPRRRRAVLHGARAGAPGAQLAQWAEIKAAASETLLALGGTITHHHAVGRDHRPWYDRERPDGFARALAAAKRRSIRAASSIPAC